MFEPKVRKSDEQWKIERQEFKRRFDQSFKDPYFEQHQEKISELEELSWKIYEESRKTSHKTMAGKEFKDPNFEVSIDWLNTRKTIREAQTIHDNHTLPAKVLLICASDRNDHTCPGEISKSYRLTKIAEESLKSRGIEVEVLNLSKIISEYGKMIYPCKGCVSTAMPLCHWPCSCYPNQALGQVHDWMNEIYPMWVRAHGIMIITPVYWHQSPSVLKLMIDRLVCADGGNPDPTTTQGKDPQLAKSVELQGWSYPRHLQGRIFSVIVHGDTQGVDELKNALTAWLSEMMLIPASIYSQIGRYIGYYGPYADSHKELDKDKAIMDEVRNASESLFLSIQAEREKKLTSQLPQLKDPRPK